jgi:hypothetical protein
MTTRLSPYVVPSIFAVTLTSMTVVAVIDVSVTRD